MRGNVIPHIFYQAECKAVRLTRRLLAGRLALASTAKIAWQTRGSAAHGRSVRIHF